MDDSDYKVILESCAKCGATPVYGVSEGCHYDCKTCGQLGGAYAGHERALEGWNREQERLHKKEAEERVKIYLNKEERAVLRKALQLLLEKLEERR